MRSALLALATLPLVLSHTSVVNFYVNGVDQGDGMCLRLPTDEANINGPVEDIRSNNMACGNYGPVPRACSVPDGATLTFKYLEESDNPSVGVLDPSHSGSCAVWLKKVNDATTDPGNGDGWFKIWDMGADANNKWCTNTLIDNGGLMTITLPPDLLGGYYLVRTELLALHNANKGDPQYYISCAQVYVQGSGNLVPQSTVNIPDGYVTKQDAADSWDLYCGSQCEQNAHNFVPPGPAPAALQAGATVNSVAMSRGTKPAGCILEAGNFWCGVEVPDYHDSNSCNAASSNCWQQHQPCWDLNQGFTNKNCNIWQQKCENLDAQCNSHNFNGPIDKGQDLTPPKGSIQAPPPLGPTKGAAQLPGYSAPIPSKAPPPAVTTTTQAQAPPPFIPTTTKAPPLQAVPTTTQAPAPVRSTITRAPTTTKAPGYGWLTPKPQPTTTTHWFHWPPWWIQEHQNIRAGPFDGEDEDDDDDSEDLDDGEPEEDNGNEYNERRFVTVSWSA